MTTRATAFKKANANLDWRKNLRQDSRNKWNFFSKQKKGEKQKAGKLMWKVGDQRDMRCIVTMAEEMKAEQVVSLLE